MAQNAFDYGRQIMIVSLVGITLLVVVTGCNNKGISMTGNSNKEVTSDNQKAVPTPEPTLSPEAIFDQNIHDFLNSEGEYTQQKIWDNIILSENNKANLGVTHPAQPSVEGFLIDYLKKDDNMVMIVGFDGKDEKRFVTAMAIATGFYDQSDQMGFYFIRLSEGAELSSHTTEEHRATEKTTIKYLELLKGKPANFDLDIKGFP